MSLEKVVANAVIIAKQFNPSIIREIWLVENDILLQDEFLSGCIYTDAFVNVRSKAFNFFAAPDRLQFLPIGEPAQLQEIVVGKLGRIVQILRHTPFSAVGVNFNWHLHAEDEDVHGLTRALFTTPDQPICRAFPEPDARFGAYGSKNALGFRLKLDIKPVVTDNGDRIQFAFNFHLDLPEEGSNADRVVEMLRKWNEAAEMSTDLVNEITQREAETCSDFVKG